MLMVFLSAIKRAGFFVDSLNALALIFLKLSVQWSSLLQSRQFFRWLFHVAGLSINWMSTTPSFMTLSETVICTQPAGFADYAHPDYVYRLSQSLYGLKQAPWAWYDQFTSHLIQLSFVEAKSDISLFVCHKGANMVYLLYVDVWMI